MCFLQEVDAWKRGQTISELDICENTFILHILFVILNYHIRHIIKHYVPMYNVIILYCSYLKIKHVFAYTLLLTAYRAVES